MSLLPVLGEVRWVVVVRALPGLGDMLCGVPALRALRAALPGAHIALVALPAHAWLADRYPAYIDEVLPFPGYPGIPYPDPDHAAIPAFYQAMWRRGFDLALQLHGSGVVSNPMTVLLGARRTAAAYLPGHYCPDPALCHLYAEGEHEVVRALRVLEGIGVAPAGLTLEFPVTAADWAALPRDLAALPPCGYACLHPGASAPANRWPAERFAAVGDALATQGLSVVLTGGPAEVALADHVAGLMRSTPVLAAGGTGLGALAALVQRAALLVCNDTGVSHLAAAVGTPSVVMFTGASDPGRWAPLDGDRHMALVPAAAGALPDVSQVLDAVSRLAPVVASTESR